MGNKTDYCVVMATCGSREEAEKLAGSILENKLAACIQLTDIRSYYFWEGRVENDPEVLLLMKTRGAIYHALESHIKANHSYDVPEIIRLPIEGGLPAYLGWIDEVTPSSKS